LGILFLAAGLLKLLSPQDGVLPVLPDLIPAEAGLLTGYALNLEYYRSHATVESDKTEELYAGFSRNKKLLGFIAIISAALHFLFPGVLLL
jgi:hypothetical protein